MVACDCSFCGDGVFRCFRWLERCADRITGAAGPFFVALAIVLISSAVFSFFTVIQPQLPWPWISMPICLLIAANIFGNYYYACTISPGFVDKPFAADARDILWAPRTSANHGVQWSEEMGMTKARLSQCRKCGCRRPERAHHCRICKSCVLKYDHHCPWINQCVGLHNERYFILFMAYLVVGSAFFGILGFASALNVFDFDYEWPYLIPSIIFILDYVLAVVLCIAVGIMLTWHLLSITRGETTVESHDHALYRSAARNRGEQFVNSFNVGSRRNLALFFNIGLNGHPWWTLLLPLKTMPYSDGWAWVRRDGLESHIGVNQDDELTDDED